ncbi:unnamed protein product [Cyprideis torosa]|uniref:Uncharacterized protein n=1 Tax=Cyprideis torosa TaxID=163714 RepID=A0A7R8ZRS9_9CRUS|nr:unnamed protein product [Cyprideis torosa]CAG0893896.1 unnamed protein product [Cyprideis torosa]
MHTVQEGHYPALHRLLNKFGADLNTEADFESQSPLYCPCIAGDPPRGASAPELHRMTLRSASRVLCVPVCYYLGRWATVNWFTSLCQVIVYNECLSCRRHLSSLVVIVNISGVLPSSDSSFSFGDDLRSLIRGAFPLRGDYTSFVIIVPWPSFAMNCGLRGFFWIVGDMLRTPHFINGVPLVPSVMRRIEIRLAFPGEQRNFTQSRGRNTSSTGCGPSFLRYEGVPVNWLSDDSETSKTFVLFPPNWEDIKFYEKARKEAAEPQADWLREEVAVMKTSASWRDICEKIKKTERLGNIGENESEMEGTGVIVGRKRRATAGIWYSQEPESSEDDVSDSSGSHEAIVQEADSSTPESSPRGRGIKKKARRIHPAAPKLNVPPSNLSTNFRQSNSSPIRINTTKEPLPAAELEFTSPAVRPVASCSKSPSSSVPNPINLLRQFLPLLVGRIELLFRVVQLLKQLFGRLLELLIGSIQSVSHQIQGIGSALSNDLLQKNRLPHGFKGFLIGHHQLRQWLVGSCHQDFHAFEHFKDKKPKRYK